VKPLLDVRKLCAVVRFVPVTEFLSSRTTCLRPAGGGNLLSFHEFHVVSGSRTGTPPDAAVLYRPTAPGRKAKAVNLLTLFAACHPPAKGRRRSLGSLEDATR
jgi:hypothetical protein